MEIISKSYLLLLDVHIKRLREKMTYEDTWGLKTIWGVGYKFEVK